MSASTLAGLDIGWTTASESHVGMRRKINEDAILSRPDVGLWVVADGMGGHEAGDVASQMVMANLEGLEVAQGLPAFVDQIDDMLTSINVQLRQHANEHFGGRTMGCTVVGMLVRGRAGAVMWAGDSRLYRLRRGELLQITRDHSPVEELLDQGVLTPEEAAAHPDANIITRAVGGQDQLFLDIILFDILPEDVFLLCSDGLYREMTIDEMQPLLAAGDVEVSVQRLLALALERGARDNVSLIACRADEIASPTFA